MTVRPSAKTIEPAGYQHQDSLAGARQIGGPYDHAAPAATMITVRYPLIARVRDRERGRGAAKPPSSATSMTGSRYGLRSGVLLARSPATSAKPAAGRTGGGEGALRAIHHP